MAETTRDNVKKAVEELEKIFLSRGTFPQEEAIYIKSHYDLSQATLNKYATLDWNHMQDIKKLKKQITEYKDDPTLPRPLNILMIAEPGSGKSHFIDCLIEDKDIESLDVSAVQFNMAGLESADDLVYPFDNVRNLKVKDKFPLLFLDEFDAKPDLNYPLLLPLLWDGKLFVTNRALELGKAVVILAGSSDKIKNLAKGEPATGETEEDKLRDLMSRINGKTLKIPQLKHRQVDKVCIAIALLRKRFESFEVIPWTFLRFTAMCELRYEARSIAHLVNTIPSKYVKSNSISYEDIIRLPFDSEQHFKDTGLIHHLNDDTEIRNGSNERKDIVKKAISLWDEAKTCGSLISIAEEELDLGDPVKDDQDLGEALPVTEKKKKAVKKQKS